MIALQCGRCGGAIAFRAGEPGPNCLFCGSEALVPADQSARIAPPEGRIPFVVTKERANGEFRAFARSSFWYPGAIRRAEIVIEPLFLPAWAWRGELETTWTGLVSAPTRSGKRPVTGEARRRFDQVLIPASATLTVRELRNLGRYDESTLCTAGALDAPEEISELTRDAARDQAFVEMEIRHRTALEGAHELSSVHTASIAVDLSGSPVRIPVWIGVYRHRDVPYRILVNGQSGSLVGEAPISRLKVGMATLTALAGIAAIAAILGGL